ncbi:hypothetical protein [Pararhizobium sp. DWP3-4]|uniref:hypothetical protein n=1 Tax=Pararhizobium sp. DWP3-4 TaxID=2804565 RepID=UPI003CF0E007
MTGRKQKNAYLLALLLHATTVNADDRQYDRWTATEATSIDDAVTEFESLCVRRFQHSVEKQIKSDYETSHLRTEEHCLCVSDSLLEKNDLTFVQIINLELKNRLVALPELPGELEIYLQGFDEVRSECLQRDINE